MNVLYYLESFPKLSETFVVAEIEELRRRGHEVAVCCSERPPEGRRRDGVDVAVCYIDAPTYRDATALASAGRLGRRALADAASVPPKSHVANVSRARQCVAFVESLGWVPDHVHAHFASRSKFAGRYAADYFDASFTVTTHAFDIYSEPVDPAVGRLLDSAERVVTVSEYNRDYLRERFDPDAPVDVVRAGVRLDRFAPTDRTRPGRVVTVARLVGKKGIPDALAAVARAAETVSDLTYHVVGSGPQREELDRTVEQLGIGDRVTFLGTVDDRRIHAELDAAQSFLLPCRVVASGDRDGIPVALVEAMAMETPPVSTTVSGVPELVEDGTTGLLTEPRSPAATADALVGLLTGDATRRAYGRRARETVTERFDVRSTVTTLEATFRAATRAV